MNLLAAYNLSVSAEAMHNSVGDTCRLCTSAACASGSGGDAVGSVLTVVCVLRRVHASRADMLVTCQ